MTHPAIIERKLNVNMDMTWGLMEDADGITDDDLNEVTKLVAYGYDYDVDPPRETAAPLSPRIGLCS
jgi:hypothetical protein